MTKEERIILYNKATDKWGFESQLDQLIEECAELIVSINKLKRSKIDLQDRSDEIFDNFIEEICDTFMCIEQMKNHYGEEVFEKKLNEKLIKFEKQLNKPN